MSYAIAKMLKETYQQAVDNANTELQEFLATHPKGPMGLTPDNVKAKAPLKDASAVNSTRWALFESLKQTGLPVAVASGGQTKYNRTRLHIPKTHALDAACVGELSGVEGAETKTLPVKCCGRGAHQRTRVDQYGFPKPAPLMRGKSAFGFRTGDMVKAVVPKGKKAGTHTGRVAIRARGIFNIQTQHEMIKDVSHRFCKVLQRGDGYGFNTVAKTDANGTPPKQRTASLSALSRPGLNAEVPRAIL